MSEPRWVKACDLEELPVGGAHVVREGRAVVALFRPSDEGVFAVDNRCPHEGYPLARGYVKDCVVTCPWHNYKFDLRDGRCVLGDEDVRVYPVRVSGGAVEIDVAEPDPEVERPRLFASLEDGLAERKLGQVARDVVRLLALGTDPTEIAFAAVRFDAERAPYGTTHVMPLAVCALALADRFAGEDAVLPLMQPMDMAAAAHTRRPRRGRAGPADPGPDAEAAGVRLRELVEGEDVEAAEALLRGALARGWGREVVEPWLYRLCADHFLDFGHALIYQVKIFDLLERVGWDRADEVLPAHLVGIANGTREDTLPEWRHFRRRLDRVAGELPGWMAAQSAPREVDVDALCTALVDGTRDEAFDAVETELRAGGRIEQVIDALSLAACRRMLRFDVAIDADRTVQEGWLDVTHLLTYVEALRAAAARFREPELLRLVLYGVRFVTGAAPLDLPPGRRPALAPSARPRHGSEGIAELLRAVSARDTGRALALAAAYVEADFPADALRVAIEDGLLDDPLTRPIVVAHGIKTCDAAFAEHRRLGPSGRGLPLLALVRFLASPVRERPVARLAHEAVRFVVHGQVPRTLT